MARLPRVVIPGIPHHVTQRGDVRQRTFFEEADYGLYLDRLAQAAERAGTEIWSYCLMPNHGRRRHVKGGTVFRVPSIVHALTPQN